MIREIVNYVKYLKEKTPQIFEQGLKPTKGIHIFVELDNDGQFLNFPGSKGVNWDYYDGKEMSPFLQKIIKYEQQAQRVGTKMNKVFDKKKQIVSCSPYMVSFKKEKLDNPKIDGVYFEKIINLLPFYFEKSIETCFSSEKIIENKQQELPFLKKEKKVNNTKILNIINQFKSFLIKNINILNEFSPFLEMKKDKFINIYLKNICIDDYEKAHQNYLKQNLFNKNDFNSDTDITDDTYGLSGFYNGLKSKKIFLEHKTGSMYKGLSGRIQAKDALLLNDFDLMLKRKIFPQPLPIFIDKKEFSNSDEILNIYREEDRLSYTQILKKIFEIKDNKVLQNYYLLNFNYKYELNDFDFVSKFRYSMEKDGVLPEIKNLYGLKKNKELKQNRKIRNIFSFEADIVKTVFNNSLVKIKDEKFSTNYFDVVKPEFVSGGELIYRMIMKYRKGFYDYIYKSKTQAINFLMWDEIMWNTIIGDLRTDKLTEKGYHNKDYSIKEKLNIWFSLYNYFGTNKRRIDMASKLPELLAKMKKVANDKTEHFSSVDEFLFGAGQLIYYLLNQSKASERTHALLEPFIQKVKSEQLQNSITNAINKYKHELKFGQGRFERLSAEVLGFETSENLKKHHRFLLAGYFAEPVIYEKNEKEIIENTGGEN